VIGVNQTASNTQKYSPLRSALLLFLLLVSADLAFVLIHAASKIISPTNEYTLLSLESDEGYPEAFQYIKWFWLAILFIFLSVKRKALNYSVWGLFFSCLLIDDALSLHEKAGAFIAGHLDLILPFGMRPQEIGELIFAGTVGLFLLSLILSAFKRGSRAFRRMSCDTLLLVAVLVFFGIVVDMAHVSSARIGGAVTGLLGIIEDGGEMLVASAMLGYAFAATMARGENAAPFLLGGLRSVLRRRSTRGRMR